MAGEIPRMGHELQSAIQDDALHKARRFCCIRL
jgi:hypothetical protein